MALWGMRYDRFNKEMRQGSNIDGSAYYTGAPHNIKFFEENELQLYSPFMRYPWRVVVKQIFAMGRTLSSTYDHIGYLEVKIASAIIHCLIYYSQKFSSMDRELERERK